MTHIRIICLVFPFCTIVELINPISVSTLYLLHLISHHNKIRLTDSGLKLAGDSETKLLIICQRINCFANGLVKHCSLTIYTEYSK